MTEQQYKRLMARLKDEGYTCYTNAIPLQNEDFFYAKTRVEDETLYQVLFLIYDWRQFVGAPSPYGLTVLILVLNAPGYSRVSMEYSPDKIDVKAVERLAERFFKFVTASSD